MARLSESCKRTGSLVRLQVRDAEGQFSTDRVGRATGTQCHDDTWPNLARDLPTRALLTRLSRLSESCKRTGRLVRLQVRDAEGQFSTDRAGRATGTQCHDDTWPNLARDLPTRALLTRLSRLSESCKRTGSLVRLQVRDAEGQFSTDRAGRATGTQCHDDTWPNLARDLPTRALLTRLSRLGESCHYASGSTSFAPEVNHTYLVEHGLEHFHKRVVILVL